MVDRILDAMADDERRRILVDLLEYDSGAVSDSSEMPSGVPAEIAEPEEVLVRVRHLHLPKLDDYGLVDWDADERMVTRGPRFDEARPFLEVHRTEFVDGKK